MVGQKEEAIIDAFYNKYPAHVIRNGTGGHSAGVDHPTPNIIWGGASTGQDDITTTDNLNSAALREIYKEARTKNINPISVGGAEVFVVLAHVRAMQNLMADATAVTGINELFGRGGMGQDNPIVSRSEVYYSGCCVHEYNRVRSVYNATPATNNSDKTIQCMVLGADALVLANGSEPRLVRRKEDRYEDVYGIGIKQIFGTARADWMDRSDTAGNTINQSSLQYNVYAAL